MSLLLFRIAGISVAPQDAQGHERAAHRAAYFPKPPHAPAEGGGQPGGFFHRQAGFVAEGAEHRLGAVVPFPEEPPGLRFVIHEAALRHSLLFTNTQLSWLKQ